VRLSFIAKTTIFIELHKEGKLPTVEFIHSGVPVDLRAEQRSTALHLAAAAGHSAHSKNRWVLIGDMVALNAYGDIPFAKRIYVLPIKDALGTPDNTMKLYLKPYFLDAFRPVNKGELFLVKQVRRHLQH
jgi:hypothetical protein